MDKNELIAQTAQEGLVYIPKERKFVSSVLQVAVLKFGPEKISQALTAERIGRS